jgi:hypothetical protein
MRAGGDRFRVEDKKKRRGVMSILGERETRRRTLAGMISAW